MMVKQPLSNLNHPLLSRRRFLITLAGGLGWMLSGFSSQNRRMSGTRSLILGRVLMGTMVEIEVNHPDLKIARQAVMAGFDQMAEVDRLMSIFRPDSEISLVNRLAATQRIHVGPHTYAVLAEAERLARLSRGTLDITVGPLMKLWSRAARQGRLPSRRELDTALELVGFEGLSLDPSGPGVRFRHPGMSLDLGGIAKGYAVDVAVETLRGRGVQSGMVNAGGDLRVIGRNRDGGGWRIGLLNPINPRGFLLSILVEDEGVATSGNYFNYFTVGGKRYGHILNPRTGYPSETILSVTVITKDAMRADGLATAAMVYRAEEALEFLQKRSGIEGIMVTALDRHPGKLLVHVTEGLKGRVEPLTASALLA